MVRSVLSICLAVQCIGCVAVRAEVPGMVTYGPGRITANLRDKHITESSGLACSRITPGAFWTHNDSGDAPQLYRFDLTGRSLGLWRVPNARAVDWEDIASVVMDGNAYLVVADTGDNNRVRRDYAVYVVEEPNFADPNKVGSSARAVPFVYEDGKHDAEAVAVDCSERMIYLVTKELLGAAKVYSMPWPPKDAQPASGPAVLKTVTTLPLTLVTGMDISPDGRRAVVLTYGGAFQYVRSEGESWPTAFRRAPAAVSLPLHGQVEAVCYGPDGRTLYLTQEGAQPPFAELVPLARSEQTKTQEAGPERQE